MKQQCEYISGAANTVASSVCWTQLRSADLETREIVAYCVDNLVAIVDVSKSLVTETLRGHTGRINVLTATQSYLISASEDSTVRVWSMGSNAEWEEYAVLSGLMRSSIIALACLNLASGILIVASDVTGRVIVWLKETQNKSFHVLQVMDMPAAQMPHDLHLAALPALGIDGANTAGNILNASDVLLFIGSVDTRIHIRVASQQRMRSIIETRDESKNDGNAVDYFSTGIFNLVGMLTGHEEWVTCLASARVENNSLLLASGSKDTKIRLWRLAFSPRSSIPHGAELEVVNLDKFNLNDEDYDEDDEGILDAPEGVVTLEPDESLSEARLIFAAPCGSECSVFLEALLIGHEDWVTSVHWMMPDSDLIVSSENEGSKEDLYRLYSTSMDRYVRPFVRIVFVLYLIIIWPV